MIEVLKVEVVKNDKVAPIQLQRNKPLFLADKSEIDTFEQKFKGIYNCELWLSYRVLK